MRLRFTSWIAVGVLGAMAVIVGCSKPDPNIVTVGMALNYPPFETVGPDGDPMGISVEMAKALAASMGKKLKIENIPFVGLIPALNAGKIDLILSSMTATDERRQSVDFSDPYLTTGLSLLVKKESPITSITDADQSGKTLAVCSGTTGEAYAREHVKNANVIILEKENLAVMEVIQGKADAFLYDQMSTWQNAQSHPDTTKALLKPFQTESWAIAVKKGNAPLLQSINGFLKEYRGSGGFEKLGDRFLSAQKAAFAEQGIPFVF